METITATIAGYRQLSADEQALINEGKALGNLIDAYLGKIDGSAIVEGGPDRRWLAIARTEMQKGLMAAVRAIAKPTGF